MKNIFIAIFSLVIVLSCKKKVEYAAPFRTIETDAFLRVMHVSANFRAIQNNPDSFDIYVGTSKINGTLFTYNAAFPATAINTNTYAAVPSGAQQIRLSLRGVVKTDSLTIMSLQKVLEPGKYYTLFITDSLNAQQDPSRVWVNDVTFLPTDTNQYKVRFAHMILNDSAGKKVDVYSYRQAANIFSAVAPGTVTDFAAFNVPSTLDTISIRRTGTGFELARISGVSFSKTRLYTILYKGSPGVVGAATGTGVTGTNVRARSVIVYNNR